VYSIPEVIGKKIEREAQGIYPLQNVYIRKVKVLKAPRFDAGKLLEVRLLFFFSLRFLGLCTETWQLHGEGSAVAAPTEDTGKKV
jgi:hypothetical protein